MNGRTLVVENQGRAGHRNVEYRPVLGLALALDGDLLTSFQTFREPVSFRLTIRRHHHILKGAAKYLLGPVAKHALEGVIDAKHAQAGSLNDQGIWHRLKQALEMVEADAVAQ